MFPDFVAVFVLLIGLAYFLYFIWQKLHNRKTENE